VSVLYGSERVPQPHEAVCAVSNDLSTRTVTVRLSDLANNGYTRLLWKEAWRALRTWEESGSPRHPTIWASAPGAYQAAYAVTGNPEFGGSLRFTFPKGEQSYVQLISKPMAASAWIDKSTNRFINVVLKHRQG
jgi:hypothetical protein